MKNDVFGHRMKAYEAVETARKLDTSLPIYARIDGHGFSKFTRGLRRPFDERMSAAMIDTTRVLVDATDAKLGYTQSDEISLVWMAEKKSAQMYFDGKVQKLASVLAGLATAAFTRAVLASDAEFAAYAERLPHFDARVFSLPSREEACNALVWREKDAVRNAVAMVAQAHFSHKELHGVSVAGMREKIAERGIDYEGLPTYFRRGTYLRRVVFERAFTADELATIPEKHRPAPGALVTRSEVRALDLPPIVTVGNRVAVVFDGAEPEITAPVEEDPPA